MIGKKRLIVVGIGAVIFGLITMSVSADRTNKLPDTVGIHHVTYSDGYVDGPIIEPVHVDDRDGCIEPYPVPVDDTSYLDIDLDIITDDIGDDDSIVIMPYDTNECIGIIDDTDDAQTQSRTASMLGPLGLVGLLGCVLVSKKRK
jgi:hypothetical protein